MREHRWESRFPFTFPELLALCERLRKTGVKTREWREVRACYFDEFRINDLGTVERLSPWILDELTLVETNTGWDGDFFLLAGRHHEIFRTHERMEAYLSLCHLWKITLPGPPRYHESEAMIWIGYRDTHTFIRIRLVPVTIIAPGEARPPSEQNGWLKERAEIFACAIEELGLPIRTGMSDDSVTLQSADPSALVSSTWPDAFGPCQFEFVVSDKYALLVPASRFVSRYGLSRSKLRVFISGFPVEALEKFRSLQPESELFYRGFIQASINDLPEVIAATEPSGKALINLCDFEIAGYLGPDWPGEGVIGLMGDEGGYKIEIRLNRMPLSLGEAGKRLEEWTADQLVYAPLPVL